MAPNHGGDPLGFILGPMGSHWIQKMGQNRKKLPCPKIRIFGFPAVIDFSQKIEVTVMAPNHGGDPLGSILGQKINGVPLGPKKWVKTAKNDHARKFEFLATPRSSIFRKKSKLRLWRQITVGIDFSPRVGPSWGQWGPIGSKKWVKTVKNDHAPKFEFLAIDFSQKIEVTVMAPNHGGDPLGSILGPMGSHWVQKIGQNKLPCPKKFLAVIDFSQKIEVTVMAPNHGGDP